MNLKEYFREPKFIFAVFTLLMVVLLVMSDRQKIFTLNVSTEVVQFSVADPLLSEWMIGNARLIDNPFSEDSEGADLGKHSVLILNTGTQVRIQRHGVDYIRLLLTTDNQSSIGRIEDAEGHGTTLADWALLLIEVSGQPLVFPFRGTLTAGDDVAIGVDSILLSGTISVVEEQLLGKTHYTAGVETLDPGDRVQLWRREQTVSGSHMPATVDGFIRAEPMDGFSEPIDALALVAHGQADYVQVERLGSAGYEVRAPRWARFLHDPLLAATTAIIALMALLLEFSSKCIEVVQHRRGQDRTPLAANDQADDTGDGTRE
ncbi:MAG: hypothetical protein B6D77_07390 [gamma proteobacterium symbiont of Ctena orbiculata]|nr:MAG: hypothetical protein B6D77_07390 [gamma proteobacterium symbiont of Ctena orbiculata]PVV18688.1 MAG: hypothetical protein B6D78_15625 [gamma proteobacterium symbiont of Ctena orbiculata]